MAANVPTLFFLIIVTSINAVGATACSSQVQMEIKTREAQAALTRAMNQGDTASALAVIRAGIDVNARDLSRRTPLLWAAQWGRFEVAKALLTAGADPNVRDLMGATPLALAFAFGHFDIVQSLVEAGADRSQIPTDLNAKDSGGSTPMMRAFRNKDMRSVRALIQLGASPNGQDGAGRSFLAWAAIDGDLETVRMMVAGGADANTQDKQGWTALMLAAQAGHSDVVQALLAKGADANLVSPGAWNALMYASYRGDLKSTQALIPATNVNYRNNKDVSALMIARWGCHAEIVKTLANAGATSSPQEWKRVPRFEDFPLRRIYKGRVAKVDLASTPLARAYRTRIREGARQGPNFAGHYTVVSWGCGSNCQAFAIVNALTGKVYDAFGAERGADFKINSNLIIADPAYPEIPAENDPVGTLPVRYFVWKDNSLTLIYEQSCSPSASECDCEQLARP